MLARRPDEPHRTATSLELFFDLCFVVAVAQAAAGMHHAISENHIATGVIGYLMVFFAIWWAWMNFTWFASAYDTDDVPYRLTTLVQIAGALILAAGVPQAMTNRDFTVITAGYVVMRLAMVTQWLRAARGDTARRAACLRFAVGITLVQIGWTARLALPDGWGMAGFIVLVIAELIVPVWAEHAAPTTWHPHHIAERYGLFTVIVLGESVAAATIAIQSAVSAGHKNATLLTLAASGLLIVFSMWWLYFAQPSHNLLTSLTTSMVWGYGHYAVFASAAAVGAGLQVAVDYNTHAAHVPAIAAGYAIAAPAAAYVLSVGILLIQRRRQALLHAAYLAIALLILVTPFTAAPVTITAALLAVLVVTNVLATRRWQAIHRD
jgi:low temperature requirement protein LtrA